MRPVTPEEQIIAYADKFYSKGTDAEKTVSAILAGLAAYGREKAAVFRRWAIRFEGYKAFESA